MTHREKNLSIAGRLLLLEIVLGVALMFVLEQLGLESELALIGIWAFNLLTATYLFKAARAQGKSGLFYGLLSALGPPVSFLSFFRLHSNQALANLG